MKAVLLAGLLVWLGTSVVAADSPPPRELAEVEAALKEKPDDPTLHAEKCRALFAQGKEQEAIDHAAIALAKFQGDPKRPASIELGTITTKTHRIEVHYNLGPKEIATKKDGIVRPYSFRFSRLTPNHNLVRTIDFEHAYSQGKLVSAAIGEMTSKGHANFVVIDADSDFATIKKKVVEIVGGC